MKFLLCAAALLASCSQDIDHKMKPLPEWRITKYDKDTKEAVSETMFWNSRIDGMRCVYGLYIDHVKNVTRPTLSCG